MSDLAARVLATMKSRGFPVAVGSDVMNIVYVEGMDPDGKSNQNRPNAFDATRMLVRVREDGTSQVLGAWEAITHAGLYYETHRLNPDGAFHIRLGQQTCWTMGHYHDMEALIQTSPIEGTRDASNNFKREGPAVRGDFGVHHHWGYDYPRDDANHSSAGCQVGRTKDGHREFIALLKTDRRYVADKNFRFTSTVLLVEWLPPVDLVPPRALSATEQVLALASGSDLAKLSWPGRGRAPIGYVKGMAAAYERVYRKWKAKKPSALAAEVSAGELNRDALAWYGLRPKIGVDALRTTFALLVGLGMRESSGRYCEGRDRSARNTSSDTAEAGLFQMSWDIRAANNEIAKLLAEYRASSDDGLVGIFREGVTPAADDLQNYGTGDGAIFQDLCKKKPAFAVEVALVGLRSVRTHWGPINRREAELRPECVDLLKKIETVADRTPASTIGPVPAEKKPTGAGPAAGAVAGAGLLAGLAHHLGAHPFLTAGLVLVLIAGLVFLAKKLIGK